MHSCDHHRHAHLRRHAVQRGRQAALGRVVVVEFLTLHLRSVRLLACPASGAMRSQSCKKRTSDLRNGVEGTQALKVT